MRLRAATLMSTLAFAACALAAANSTWAADVDGAKLAQHGNNRGAPSCAVCHGRAGEGNSAYGFPRLAGLPAHYLQAQLDAYANGQRRHPMMRPIAETLAAPERTAVAAYYASLPLPQETGGSSTASGALGARLALQGRGEQDLPACVKCHGPAGVGVGETFPPLAGQPAQYLEHQLHAWQAGTRAPGPLGLMGAVAAKLSDRDIRSVAAFFAALPAAPPRPESAPLPDAGASAEAAP